MRGGSAEISQVRQQGLDVTSSIADNISNTQRSDESRRGRGRVLSMSEFSWARGQVGHSSRGSTMSKIRWEPRWCLLKPQGSGLTLGSTGRSRRKGLGDQKGKRTGKPKDDVDFQGERLKANEDFVGILGRRKEKGTPAPRSGYIYLSSGQWWFRLLPIFPICHPPFLQAS